MLDRACHLINEHGTGAKLTMGLAQGPNGQVG